MAAKPDVSLTISASDSDAIKTFAELIKSGKELTQTLPKVFGEFKKGEGAAEGAQQQLIALNASMRELKGQSGAIKSFAEQNKKLRELQAQYGQARKQFESLKASLKDEDEPSPKLVKSAEAAHKAFSKSAEAVERQRKAIAKLREGLKEANIPQQGFANSQKEIDSALTNVASAIETTQKEYDQLTVSQDKNAASSKRVARSKVADTIRKVRAQTRQLRDELRESARSYQALAKAQDASNESARKAVRNQSASILRKIRKETRALKGEIRETKKSYDDLKRSQDAANESAKKIADSKTLKGVRRLKREIIGIAAAYGGLRAAQEGIAGTFNTADTLDAANIRFKVAFEGDGEAAAKELEFVRFTANRLKLDFKTLATEYSQFLGSIPDAKNKLDDARQAFVGLSTAARVNRLNQEQLTGAMNAFVQIQSKGAVQSEELRGQLGDRLAGAVEDYARSLGFATDEFLKLVVSGSVGSETLVDFARLLEHKFGSELPAAIESPSSIVKIKKRVNGLNIGWADTANEHTR